METKTLEQKKAKDTKMKEQMKAWIDSASYETLLRTYRFSKLGDPLFQSEIGVYYGERLFKMKSEMGQAAHAKISKKVGFHHHKLVK